VENGEEQAMEPATGDDCTALRAEIERLQKDFESMWLAVSRGEPVPPTYRTTRTKLDELRARYTRDCGQLQEDTSLPGSITADWRAG
jgi:hypothetical protein